MSLLQTPNIPTIEMARLLIWLMRAMKPEKAPGAELNDDARLRAFMEQMSVNLTVAPFPTGVQAPLNSAYGHSVDNYGPEILQSLRLAATKGGPLVSKTARMYLQLAHRSREYRFRFCLTHIVHTHRTVMLHPAMRESAVTFATFAKDYLEVGDGVLADGDQGWYAYLRNPGGRTRMSFTDLARGCSTLYALADLIQDSTYQFEPNKKWMGFQSARKSVMARLGPIRRRCDPGALWDR